MLVCAAFVSFVAPLSSAHWSCPFVLFGTSLLYLWSMSLYCTPNSAAHQLVVLTEHDFVFVDEHDCHHVGMSTESGQVLAFP